MSKGKKALLIILIIILLAALVYAAVMIFQVREVVVEGCEKLDAAYVVQLSGLENGQNIFLMDKQAVMEALSSEPFIKPVSVEMEFPDRVVITITERKPAAYIEKESALLVIDKEGWLLEVRTQPDGTERPLVYGLQADTVEVGRSLAVGDSFRLDVLSRVIEETQNSGIGTDSIDVSLAADIVLKTTNGLKVELGDDTNLASKLALAKVTIKELEKLGKVGGILDVSSQKDAYYREN